MSNLHIRTGKPSDVATLAIFNIRLAQETESIRLNPGTVERGVRGVFEDPSRGTYYVAEIDGTVVGCLMITHEWSDWRAGDMWWVQSVYVHADHRRRGVFKALWSHVHKEARSAGAVAIRLYVEGHNEKAKKTYSSLGMSSAGYEVWEIRVDG